LALKGVKREGRKERLELDFFGGLEVAKFEPFTH